MKLWRDLGAKSFILGFRQCIGVGFSQIGLCSRLIFWELEVILYWYCLSTQSYVLRLDSRGIKLTHNATYAKSEVPIAMAHSDQGARLKI